MEYERTITVVDEVYSCAKTVLIIEEYHCYQLHTEFYSELVTQDIHSTLLGTIIFDFHVTEKLLII
jgi:hypothetical protein